MKVFKVECPQCRVTVNVPFIEELKAKAIGDYNLAEVSAQEELSGLRLWLYGVSLWGIIKWWVGGRDG